jgi:hypothetical protein
MISTRGHLVSSISDYLKIFVDSNELAQDN